MKIQVTEVEKILISDVENQDNISVYFEDFGPGQGHVIIKQYCECWESFWGGCGEDGIKAFFLRCDASYLTKKLVKHDRMSEPDIEETKKKIKRSIIELRKDGSISREDIKEFWRKEIKDRFSGLNKLYEMEDIEEWASRNNKIDDVHILYDWYDNIVYQLTPEAKNMKYRIIPTIKKALIELDKENVA